MANSEVTALFRAAVRHEWDTVDHLLDLLSETGWPGGVQAITAVFASAVDRLFVPGQDVRDITGFVARIRRRLAPEDDINPLEAEALIRAALGETALAEPISADSAMQLQTVLALQIIGVLRLDDQALDQFLAEAEALADRWSRGP